jgi:gamma-glutamylcyclotransferase (GGCT)/AIG2-like uncharacterized protein YtfP
MPIRSRAARARPRPASDAGIEPPRSTSLFAYGTLADDRKVAALLARPVAGSRAELLDCERLDPGDFPYPLVAEAAGRRVAGRLYRHLSDEDFARLDAHEGVAEELYYRDLGRVVRPGEAAAAGEEAWVYFPTERTLARRRR